MSQEIVDAVREIEREKGIESGTLVAALEDALLAAYKKTPGASRHATVELDDKGDFRVFSIDIPEELETRLLDEAREQALDDLERIEEETGEKNHTLLSDDDLEIDWSQIPDQLINRKDVTPDNFGRIAAQTAKQVILQRIREAEREMMYDEYIDRVGEVVTGIVQQTGDRRNILVDLGKVEALLPGPEQVDGERYEQGSRIKAVIREVRTGTKGPQVILSRRDPELIKTLFELEVPEIADGLVVIRGVAREPGYRSKIAVESHAQGVDPVGACVGPRGSRVRMVVSELRGEKIDIIPWNNEPARFVAKALSPARVREVYLDDEGKEATVVVPDDQLALAIGKEGMNARLAARLTGWKIDITLTRSSPSRRPTRPSAARAPTARTSPGAARRSSRTASAAPTQRCRTRSSAACRRTRSWRCTCPTTRRTRSCRSPSPSSRPSPTRRSPRRSPRTERRSAIPRPRSSRPGPATHRSRARTRRSTPATRTSTTGTSRTTRTAGSRSSTWPRPRGASNERRADSDLRRLRPQGEPGRAAALPRGGRRARAGRRSGARRLYLPAPALLRAGVDAPGVQPLVARHGARRPESLTSLHLTPMANGKPNRPIRPRGGGPKGRRRVVIDQGGNRPGQGQRQRPGDRPADRGPRAPREVVAPTGPVTVESGVTLRDFSQALGVAMPQIIKLLMNLNTMKTATQSLTDDEVELIAAELQREVTIKHADDDDGEPEVFEDAEESLVARPPVVTIMGHVDHGKTTLLDAIRKTSVVKTEAGGITQHIGAYQADHNGRRITFLDTPGHEAFTAMRARGAKVTDIAVLVVAADDGVMPQTKESISHARAADVPIVVAVNKIDLPDSNPDRVLAELATEGLQPEEWGGDVQIARVSAKQGENLDDLLERILLVADAELDLRANPAADASGPIIESRLDVGRGPVTTMLVQRGTLKVGDAIVAGDAWGRVRALYDYLGTRIDQALPGEPVEILGFDKPPPAGELGRVVENERRARDLAHQRGERLRREAVAKQRSRGVSLDSLFSQLQAGASADLNIVLKGDVQGSVEAIVSELGKIQHPEVRVQVIHTGVGGITENDVNLAAASNAMVVGFNVRPSAEVRQAAERQGIEIRLYRVIYQLTEEIEQALVGMLTPVETEAIIGEVEVRALFKASRVGTIAGCMVTSGIVRRGSSVRLFRDGTRIHETTVAALRRFKDDVREVTEGFECGVLLEGFNDLREGDVFEVFETREVERTSLDEPAGGADSSS
jgi:translation initiation factor IF-2